MCRELKDCFDPDVKIVGDIIVVGKDDPSLIVPTKAEFGAVNQDAQNIQLERLCAQDEPRIIGSLQHNHFDN